MSKRLKAVVAVLVVALAGLLSSCVTEPPGNDFVNDVNNDFQENDYFNP